MVQNLKGLKVSGTFLPVIGAKVVQGYVKLKGVSDKQDKISNLHEQRLKIINGLPSLKNTLILGYA